MDGVGRLSRPRKPEQDRLDAGVCLLVALYLTERRECLMVGDMRTGYIVVPHSADLRKELDARCNASGREPSEWARVFRQFGVGNLKVFNEPCDCIVQRQVFFEHLLLVPCSQFQPAFRKEIIDANTFHQSFPRSDLPESFLPTI
jgi:hypothetical protein